MRRIRVFSKRLEHSTVVRVAGRTGWICYGIVHLLLAWLTVQVIVGGAQERAGTQGAVSALSRAPFGSPVLVGLAVGLFAFAVSHLLLAAIGFTWVDHLPTRLARKAGAVGRAFMGLAIGTAAMRTALGGHSRPDNTQQQNVTGQLLALPAGRVMVGIVAVVICAVAIATVRRGILRSFKEDLDMRSLPDGSRVWLERIGLVGWCAKGFAYGVIGFLFGVAAVHANARQAGGVDKALHLLAMQAFGQGLLAIVAVGFVAFAVFCFAAARAHQR